METNKIICENTVFCTVKNCDHYGWHLHNGNEFYHSRDFCKDYKCVSYFQYKIIEAITNNRYNEDLDQYENIGYEDERI